MSKPDRTPSAAKGYTKADMERDTMTPAKQEARSAATTPTAREAKLVTALLNVANRTDGDGKPCWCHDEMRSGLFAPEHTPWCRAAREALDA